MKIQRLDHAATLRNVETSGGPRESSIRIVSTPFEALEPRDLSRREHTRWLFNSCYPFINLSLKSSRNIESSPADYSKSSCSKEHCARYGRRDGYPLIDSTSMELYFHIHKFPTIVSLQSISYRARSINSFDKHSRCFSLAEETREFLRYLITKVGKYRDILRHRLELRFNSRIDVFPVIPPR